MIGGCLKLASAAQAWASRVLSAVLLAAAACVSLALVVVPEHAAAASLAEGVWMTANGKGAVEIRPCEDRLCGYVAAAMAESAPASASVDGGEAKPPEGKGRLLINFSGGPLRWSGGVIRDPRSGRAYTGSLQLIDASTLRITGCLVAPLCSSQVWKRIR